MRLSFTEVWSLRYCYVMLWIVYLLRSTSVNALQNSFLALLFGKLCIAFYLHWCLQNLQPGEYWQDWQFSLVPQPSCEFALWLLSWHWSFALLKSQPYTVGPNYQKIPLEKFNFEPWKSPKNLILSFESHQIFKKCDLQVTKNFIFTTWNFAPCFFARLSIALATFVRLQSWCQFLWRCLY